MEVQNDKTNNELHNTLPKVLRDVLQKLASAKDIRNLEHLVTAVLEHLVMDKNSDVIELPDGWEVDMA
ncbi:hypothetical protein J3R82DRAFT_1334 [Butyriboletus roseoflavus]|nr:hypothetical protein J3R82DRAFT_1329 [Butyriboletus roseoflavus]KAG8220264.1 hypothetical protein J3R82DRAFT_1334 [Butyriboletus roseoflavus]